MTTDSESLLQTARRDYAPPLPAVFRQHGARVATVAGEPMEPASDREHLRELFPQCYGAPLLRLEGGSASESSSTAVGVILSGGQAPGGHNVIAGLFDGLKSMHPENRLVGFLGGPAGLVENRTVQLEGDTIDRYRPLFGKIVANSHCPPVRQANEFGFRQLGVSGLVFDAEIRGRHPTADDNPDLGPFHEQNRNLIGEIAPALVEVR